MWGTVSKLIRHTQTCHWICPKPFRLGGSQFWVFATNSRWVSEPQREASSETYLQHEVSNSESLNMRLCYCEVFLLRNTETPGSWSDIAEWEPWILTAPRLKQYRQQDTPGLKPWAAVQLCWKRSLYFCCSDKAPKYSPFPSLSLYPPKMKEEQAPTGENEPLLLKETPSHTALTHANQHS